MRARRWTCSTTCFMQLLTQRGSEASLGGQFSLVLLRNRGAAVQDLKSKVWMPCLEVVESRLGADVAGERGMGARGGVWLRYGLQHATGQGGGRLRIL